MSEELRYLCLQFDRANKPYYQDSANRERFLRLLLRWLLTQ